MTTIQIISIEILVHSILILLCLYWINILRIRTNESAIAIFNICKKVFPELSEKIMNEIRNNKTKC